jgi:acyl-CoA synthetase (AMP-forming)/AMP-acid ligase II
MNPSHSHNITALLDQAAARNPDRPALIFGNQHTSFAQLLEQVNQCANLLTACGLRPGERVIIMIPMSPLLYVALLGVMRCGAVAVFVDPWIPMRQIAAFAAFASPAGFIGIPKSHLLRLLSPTLARTRISISTGPVACRIPARFSLTRMATHSTDSPPAPVTPDSSALITFTSGSSGIPKGADRTHGFLKAQYEALCEGFDYRDDDVDMPMFPVFALRNLAAGITSVIPEMDFKNVASVDPGIIEQQLRTHRATLVTASPPFIDRLSELTSPPHLRKILTGGAPVNAKQLERWHDAFPDTAIEIIYGSTEAEPVAHLTSHERLATESEEGFCCGRPTPLLKTRIIKIRKGPVTAEVLDSITLPQGKTGELIVAGEHVCRGYFANPDALLENKIIEPDGTCWHRMGDTGYFDASGLFFLTGRVHSTIVRNGTILHAQIVEAEAAKQLPEATRVAALEQKGKLVIIVQGEPTTHTIDADQIIFTNTPLPLDPRHKSKIDYPNLATMLQKGKL